jgi:hypothetical protein
MKNRFESFFEDMGEKPKGLQIDRINNNRGYSPDNCRWVTRSENCNNTRKNKFLTYKNETKTMAQWSEILKLPYSRLRARIRMGWKIDDVFSLPPKQGIKYSNRILNNA